jgi:uncharacterized protein
MNTSTKMFEVKNTKKYGKGVFATRDIKKGTIIHLLDGERLTLGQLANKVKDGDEDLNDPLQIGKRTYIDLDEISRTFNHSCDPNTGLRKRSEMFALRDITKGEEITYNYSLTIAPTNWSMKCLCGTNKCQGVISDIRSIPKKYLNEYKQMGALQTYMRPIVKLLEMNKYRIPDYEKVDIKELAKE